MEEPEYLHPNFDPNTLRVRELRNILRFHKVSYHSSARKPELVSLFLTNIMPPMVQNERPEVGPIQPSDEFLEREDIQIFMPCVSQIRRPELTN